AGVGPGDIDVACFYDFFTPLVIMALEDYGFAPPGEGGPFVERGGLAWPDGRLPSNTNGGQLSEAFIHGFNNTVEAVRQIRGPSLPAFETALPYNVVDVLMDEGVHFVSQVLDCPPEEIHAGMPVEAVFVPAGDEITLVKFRRRPETMSRVGTESERVAFGG